LMSICNCRAGCPITGHSSRAECRHRRVPHLAGEPATEAISAFRCESRTVTGPAPTDGVCAYALAFSTLLSSQGADAHRHKAFAWFGGNPHILPASSGAVKRVHLMLTISQLITSPAYPATDRPGGRTAYWRESFRLSPEHRPPSGAPLVLGAGRNIRHTSDPRQIERARSARHRRRIGPRAPGAAGPSAPSKPEATPVTCGCRRQAGSGGASATAQEILRIHRDPGARARQRRPERPRRARTAQPGPGPAPRHQPLTTATPATVRRPRRSTRNRPCSRSPGPGSASSARTLPLFR